MSICSQFEISEGFQNISEFQNVIRAIDRTHFILTEIPTQDPTAYFTRKKRYAIQFYSNSDFYLNRIEYIQDEDYVL
ncbi:314_t:CDS:2, partial [Funneliformis geosporum]